MKQVKKLLILLMLSLLSLACSPVVSQVQPACVVPAKAQYATLDPQEHIASPSNIEKLLIILVDQKAYAQRLELTLQCFMSFGEN